MHATPQLNSPPRPALHDALATGSLADIAHALGWSADSSSLPLSQDVLPFWGIQDASLGYELLGSGRTWRALGVTLPEHATSASVYKVIRHMRHHNASVRCIVLWQTADHTHVAMSTSRHEPRHISTKLCHANPRQVAYERFEALSMHELEEQTWLRHIEQALDQSAITQAFYDGFVRVRRTLAARLIQGPGDLKSREHVALMVLLRLVVLYFLQGRGALDGDHWFMHHQLKRVRAQGGSLWSDLLQPLCFGALSLEPQDRDERALALGELPFLNGGLFERTELERAYPEMTWPEDVWHDVFEAFFERYSFELRASLHDVSETTVNPEMLGRVFEGLMCQSRRSKTGAFYTPAGLVRRMVEQGLSGYLEREVGLEPGELLTFAQTFELDVSPDKHKAIARALETITVLDPAVGTGAFLMESLRVLRGMWSGLADAGYAQAKDAQSYEVVRQMIHDHLYGVDVNVTAVRLCEIRVWLALLSLYPKDVQQMSPLPNLGHRLASGDSLIGPCELAMSKGVTSQRAIGPHRQSTSHARDIERLQRDYLHAHGQAKVKLKQDLERCERQYVTQLFEARRERGDHDITALENLSASPTLFGEERGLSRPLKRELLMLYRERDVWTRQIKAARAKELSYSFCYAARFGAVMSRGGFDVILTNPPWVRATAQTAQTKSIYNARYESARGALWKGAVRQGVQATFGSQVDLSALFMERSLELLRPGGRCVALVPAKLFRSLHGAALRGVMARHRIITLEDMSDAHQDLFDAATYPALIELERGEGEHLDEETVLKVWHKDVVEQSVTSMRQMSLHGRDMREPWVMSRGVVHELRAQLRASDKRFSVLGAHLSLRPRRGVMTGHNKSFCVSKADALRLCDDDLIRYARWTRGVIRGRDIRAWEIEKGAQRILWPYEAGQVAEFDALPAAMRAHFEHQESTLRARSDCRVSEPNYWRLFRVQHGIEGPKVVWRDLSPWSEAACQEGGVIPMNTAYYIPCADALRAWLMTAWLNAWTTRAMLHDLAERAQHGYRRHFAWTVSSMPIPQRWAAWVMGEEDAELEADCAFWRQHVHAEELVERRLCDALGLSYELVLLAKEELLQDAALKAA